MRDIYDMFLHKKMSFMQITRDLIHRRVEFLEGSKWDSKGRSVRKILTHPKYAGFNVYGTSSQRLYTPRVVTPKSDWTIVPGAFEALVEPTTFAEVQRMIESQTRNRSDTDMLDALRALLAKEGRLTLKLVTSARETPSPNAYRARFGAMSCAYQLVGYNSIWNASQLEKLRNIRRVRTAVMEKIVAASSNRISVENRGRRYRAQLRLERGRRVSLLVSRCVPGYKGAVRWLIQSVQSECRLVTIVVRLNIENTAIHDIWVLPPIRSCKSLIVNESDIRMRYGIRVTDLSTVCLAIRKVSAPGVPSFQSICRKV